MLKHRFLLQSRWLGRTELFGGRQDMQINQRVPEIAKEPHRVYRQSVQCRKWPGIVADKVPTSYWLRQTKEGLSVYQLQRKDEAIVFVSSTDSRKISAPTIANALTDASRGHAVQLLFEGRGVKAYLDPPFWPNLKVKMSVGAAPIDFADILRRDGKITGTVDAKTGGRVVLQGPSKKRVGRVAMKIFRATKARQLTGKGSHIAGNDVVKLKVTKKK